MRRAASYLLLVPLIWCVSSTQARAQQEPANMQLDRFAPGLDLESIVGVQTGSMRLKQDYDLWFQLGYANKLLVITDVATDEENSLVGHRLYGHLGGSWTFLDWLQVGANLPVMAYQGRGDSNQVGLASVGDLDATGIGDLQFTAKAKAFTEAQAWVDLAVLAGVTLPTHQPRDAYLGYESVTTSLGVAASKALSSLRLGGNLSYVWHRSVDFIDATIGPEIRLGLGAAYDIEHLVKAPVELAAAWHTAMRASASFSQLNESPSELMVEATHFGWLPLAVSAGAAVGLTSGIGTPRFRLFAGVRWAQRGEDRDGDRIPDKLDSCPNKPEDRDGFEDQDGCPDLDNDEDGIQDKDDACPDVPESKNGVDDDDGCPETMETKIQEGRISLSENVHFETGKAILKERSKELLRQIAKLLIDNPDIGRIRIEGHTDAQGDDMANLHLSEARAVAVQDYLVEHGVPAERLEAFGYGESRPVATNRTARGRARNRRVEFIVIGSVE